MEKKQKEKLLKYISSALQSKLQCTFGVDTCIYTIVGVRADEETIEAISEGGVYIKRNVDRVNLFVRSISSMTKTEVKDLVKIKMSKRWSVKKVLSIDCISKQNNTSWSCLVYYKSVYGKVNQTFVQFGNINSEMTIEEMDYLISHRFDVYDLLSEELAVEGVYDDILKTK